MSEDHELSDLEDAIIEDTCHCDLCGGSFLVSDNGPVIVTITAQESPTSGALGGQLKLCEHCSQRVHDAYRENLRQAGICEHGVNDGDWCEDCNREYKRARGEAG